MIRPLSILVLAASLCTTHVQNAQAIAAQPKKGPVLKTTPRAGKTLLPKLNKSKLALRVFSLTQVDTQLLRASAGSLEYLDDAGAVTRSVELSLERPVISPLGSKQLIAADLATKTVHLIDLESGGQKPLLDLARVVDHDSKSDIALFSSRLDIRSVAGDAQYLFVAVAAGFSSAIYKIDLKTNTVVDRAYAGTANPDAMVYQDGALVLLAADTGQLRTFSPKLIATRELLELGQNNVAGLAIRGGEVRVLGDQKGGISTVKLDTSKLQGKLVLRNLDKIRPIRNKYIKIKLPELNFIKRYAVLITGDLAENFAGECFWNDTVWMYKTLLANGYREEDIFVLYGDGADFISANPAYRHPTTVTDFAATAGNVNMLFDGLKNGDAARGIPKIDDNDTLFIWTFDHGGRSGNQSTLGLRGGAMLANDFATKANALPYAQRAVFMQQCYSGGFIPGLRNAKTYISTASRFDEVARPADTENEVVGGKTYSHGEYNYHITTALNRLRTNPPGGAVNADSNADTFISTLEMHNWNVANESRPETPQSADDGAIGAAFRFKK